MNVELTKEQCYQLIGILKAERAKNATHVSRMTICLIYERQMNELIAAIEAPLPSIEKLDARLTKLENEIYVGKEA